MTGLHQEVVDLKGLPTTMKIILAACLVLTLFSASMGILLMFSYGFKLDPGIATLTGSIIGLGIIAYQARLGFANLTRSQANQAQLDREARVHKAELDEQAAAAKERNDRALLLAAIRAELIGLLTEAHNSTNVMEVFSAMADGMAKSRMPAVKQNFYFPSSNTPIYDANISQIGLLGVSLAGDVIKVMNRAKRKATSTVDAPMEHALAKNIYDTGAKSYRTWANDIHHVAMRIRSIEEGWKDSGSLYETSEARANKTQTYDVPESQSLVTAPEAEPAT
jgi:hypothetical protein